MQKAWKNMPSFFFFLKSQVCAQKQLKLFFFSYSSICRFQFAHFEFCFVLLRFLFSSNLFLVAFFLPFSQVDASWKVCRESFFLFLLFGCVFPSVRFSILVFLFFPIFSDWAIYSVLFVLFELMSCAFFLGDGFLLCCPFLS